MNASLLNPPKTCCKVSSARHELHLAISGQALSVQTSLDRLHHSSIGLSEWLATRKKAKKSVTPSRSRHFLQSRHNSNQSSIRTWPCPLFSSFLLLHPHLSTSRLHVSFLSLHSRALSIYGKLAVIISFHHHLHSLLLVNPTSFNSVSCQPFPTYLLRLPDAEHTLSGFQEGHLTNSEVDPAPGDPPPPTIPSLETCRRPRSRARRPAAVRDPKPRNSPLSG